MKLAGSINLAVLGSTGSIGQNTLNLARTFPHKINIVALTGANNIEQMAKDILEFKPQIAVVLTLEQAEKLNLKLKGFTKTNILYGPKAYIQAVTETGADTVLSAIVGSFGLAPTWAAVENNLKIALANKESLVLAGELFKQKMENGLKIIPVDSEHSAIFQALNGNINEPENIRRLILTASGGPFLNKTEAELKNVTIAETLKHPKWVMGAKISCDSATMMNKGLEVIEAHYLFKMPYHKIEVLIHPQSVVHSIVEFYDASQLAQLGPTDMRLAISYALSYPQRWPLLKENNFTNYEALELELVKDNNFTGHLTFLKKEFKALKLSYQAGKAGSFYPCLLNAANEEAVAAFLQGKIKFYQIVNIIEEVLNKNLPLKYNNIEDILKADYEAKKLSKTVINNYM